MNDFDQQYENFVRQYSQMVPPPEYTEYWEPKPTKHSFVGNNRGLYLVLGLLLVASIIVSASRTIPEFGGGLVGIAAFIMMELGAVSIAFIRTRMNFNDKKAAFIRVLLTVGLVLVISVMIGANIHNRTKEAGFEAQEIELLINIAIGAIAPIMTLIIGEILAMTRAQDDFRQKEADKEYKEELDAWYMRKQDYDQSYQAAVEAWRKKMNQQWEKKTGMSITVHRESRRELPAEVSPSRDVDNETLIRQLFRDTPEAYSWSVRDIAKAVGISKSAAHLIVKKIREEG